GDDAEKNINENNNLNEEVKNYSKIELTNDEKEYIPVVSVGANVIDSNQTEGDVDKKSLTIESDLKVSRHDKLMVRKRCGEEYDGSVEIDKLVKELAKALMKDKRLNDEVKIRETEIDTSDISVVRVEKNGNNGDEAPNGRAKIVSIEMGNNKGIRDENMRYKYCHEYQSHNRKYCRDEGLAHDYGSVEEVERNEKGSMYVKNKADELEHDEMKGKEVKVKKRGRNDRGDSKRKVGISKVFKDKDMQRKTNKRKKHTKRLKNEHLPEI
ncbi:38852_t:CDS:1, partial [Gigaspora margarita]